MKPNYKVIAEYIRESLDIEYLQDATGRTITGDKEAFEALQECYLSEYGHEVKQGKNYQQTFASWLMGLPTALNIPYMNHDILQLAVSWESLPKDYTERQADKLLDNYWLFMAMQYGKEARKNKVTLFYSEKVK